MFFTGLWRFLTLYFNAHLHAEMIFWSSLRFPGKAIERLSRNRFSDSFFIWFRSLPSSAEAFSTIPCCFNAVGFWTKRLAKPCNCGFCVAAPTSANKHTSVETHFKLFSLVFWGKNSTGHTRTQTHAFVMPEHVITAQATCLSRRSRPPLGIFPHSGVLTLPAALST